MPLVAVFAILIWAALFLRPMRARAVLPEGFTQFFHGGGKDTAVGGAADSAWEMPAHGFVEAAKRTFNRRKPDFRSRSSWFRAR